MMLLDSHLSKDIIKHIQEAQVKLALLKQESRKIQRGEIMGRQLMLEQKAKQKILQQMEYLEEINSDAVTELIIPHMRVI